jgi:fructose transport system substrate-binding protein
VPILNIRHRPKRRIVPLAATAAAVVVASMVVAACGSSSSSESPSAADSSHAPIKVTLILKDLSNPYWIFMRNAARAEAAKLGVSLKVFAGQTDSDTTTQINAIEDAISAGDSGIIVVSNGNAVNSAIQKARSAGIAVYALDTVPIPASSVDMTFATDNTEAGRLIGQWAAAKLQGAKADIALLDDVTTEVVEVDVDRNHGFLEGMGISPGKPDVNGTEAKSGHYTGGQGGSYTIACQLPTGGSESGGQSAMETCLSKDPNINVVYAINEPAAEGAVRALKAADKHGVTVVAIDGACTALPFIKSGEIGATAGQFPGTMAKLGIAAVVKDIGSGVKPKATHGLDFFDTGTKLYTNSPQHGVQSVSAAHAKTLCWG